MNKIFKLMSVLLLAIMFTATAQAQLVESNLQGEYAAIDIKKSKDARQILLGKKSDDKTAMARQMESNLGDYNPEALVELGIYYMLQKDFRKAAIYTRLGLLRAAIDIKASQDLSLTDVIPALQGSIEDANSQLTSEEKAIYKNAFKDFAKDVIPLDEKTPRSYDNRWASLHSMGAFANEALNYVNANEYKKLVEKEHAQFKQENNLQ